VVWGDGGRKAPSHPIWVAIGGRLRSVAAVCDRRSPGSRRGLSDGGFTHSAAASPGDFGSERHPPAILPENFPACCRLRPDPLISQDTVDPAAIEVFFLWTKNDWGFCDPLQFKTAVGGRAGRVGRVWEGWHGFAGVFWNTRFVQLLKRHSISQQPWIGIGRDGRG